MTGPLRLAGAVCRGGVLGSAAALGVIGGQTWLARARIPSALTAPPQTHRTTWCADRSARTRRPLHLVLFGDSIAAGFGAGEPGETVAGLLAVQLSAATGRPVHISNHAQVGARSRDLREQLTRVTAEPDLAVIVVGANDITHRVRITESLRHLSYAVHQLRLMDVATVVGTCPDLGTVRPIAEPLRSLAQRLCSALAAAQADAVRRAGGVPVPLHTSVGARFAADPALFSADRFHPSAAGYAVVADMIFPSALAAVRTAPLKRVA